MTDGIVYSATGDRYISEATESAESSKEQMPSVPITLYTDRDVSSDAFDSVRVRDDFEHNQATLSSRPDMFPYDRNLFLDSDTYVCSDVTEVFEAVEKYDMAFAQSPGRRSPPSVPDCVPEFNTGVIGYQEKDTVKEFLRLWRKNFERDVEETGSTRNQKSFAESLWESEVEFLVLPREYNVRVPRAGMIKNEAKILHGRYLSQELSDVAEKLNEPEGTASTTAHSSSVRATGTVSSVRGTEG